MEEGLSQGHIVSSMNDPPSTRGPHGMIPRPWVEEVRGRRCFCPALTFHGGAVPAWEDFLEVEKWEEFDKPESGIFMERKSLVFSSFIYLLHYPFLPGSRGPRARGSCWRCFWFLVGVGNQSHGGWCDQWGRRGVFTGVSRRLSWQGGNALARP